MLSCLFVHPYLPTSTPPSQRPPVPLLLAKEKKRKKKEKTSTMTFTCTSSLEQGRPEYTSYSSFSFIFVLAFSFLECHWTISWIRTFRHFRIDFSQMVATLEQGVLDNVMRRHWPKAFFFIFPISNFFLFSWKPSKLKWKDDASNFDRDPESKLRKSGMN